MYYGVDGNGDGYVDVFNINDVVFGAVWYLCAAGGDVIMFWGLIWVILFYNYFCVYFDVVVVFVDVYCKGLCVIGILVGDIWGLFVLVYVLGSVLVVNFGVFMVFGYKVCLVLVCLFVLKLVLKLVLCKTSLMLLVFLICDGLYYMMGDC